MPQDSSPHLIAVFGSSIARPGSAAWTLAHDVGRELALAGAAVMNGGYGGLMEAVSRGAHEAGGHVVGVTVEMFERRSPVNAWVRERVHTDTLFERLRHLTERATGYVVLPGSVGTLTELFLVWTLVGVGARPARIVLLGDHWQGFLTALDHEHLVVRDLFRHVEVATSPADAARRVLVPSTGAASLEAGRG